MDIETLGTLRIDDESGESYDKLTVLLFPAGMSDLKIDSYVANYFETYRCQHSYDCCGHFYPRKARWTRLHPQSNRVVVSQGWAANI